MPCCKVGCESKDKDIIASQKIAFWTFQGHLIRTTIDWCKDHAPESIIEGFTEEDFLRDRGD